MSRKKLITIIAVCGVVVIVALAISFSKGDPVVSFTDAGLETAIREALNKTSEPIYVSELAGLASLSAENREIEDMSVLRYCTNLTVLSLYSNRISDISSLEGLTSLTRLYLGDNQVGNISALESLTNLTELRLWSNQISSISSLKGLTGLTKLYLVDNQISNISSLEGLTSLTRLYLTGNQISDISPLASLTNITELYLSQNEVNDISPLVDNLELGEGDHISLWSNPLSDTSINVYIPELQARGVFITFRDAMNLVPLDEIPDSWLEAFPEVIEEYPDGVPLDVLREMEERMML